MDNAAKLREQLVEMLVSMPEETRRRAMRAMFLELRKDRARQKSKTKKVQEAAHV